MEKIVETKKCKKCDISFNITDKDREFYDKISPTFAGEKFQIPSPTLCPECRQQRRLAWRNERKLYKRKCNATGREIISTFSPDKKSIVYGLKSWYSDAWSGLDYGRTFDFAKNFSEQFGDLLHDTPRPATLSKECENSEYGNNNTSDKDCYLLFLSFENENCYYGHAIGYAKDCLDTLWNVQSENCYECVKVDNCYKCFYSHNISHCKNSSYLSQCVSVENSCFCNGIEHKKYHILNKEYSKRDYESILNEIQNDPKIFQKYLKKFKELQGEKAKFDNNIQTQESSGDFLTHCKNCYQCFDLMQAEDCKFCYDAANIQDCYDSYLGGSDFLLPASSLSYDIESCFNCYNVLFSSNCRDGSTNLLYCDNCISCDFCFGCTGLSRKKYCIFNKQYTKEKYEKQVAKIIRHMQKTHEWGEFLSSKISLYSYNETMAQEYFPLQKEEALISNFSWSDYESPFPKVDKIIPARKLPERIEDIPDDILNWAIECEKSKKPFRITAQELKFYRKHKLPIPKRSPDQRHIDRLRSRNPRKLIKRKCDGCSEIVQTTSPANNQKRVYCQKCYFNH